MSATRRSMIVAGMILALLSVPAAQTWWPAASGFMLVSALWTCVVGSWLVLPRRRA